MAATFQEKLDVQSPLTTSHVLFAIVFTAIIAFLAGIWFADVIDSPHDTDDFELFWQSWDLLESEYYYELPQDQELIYGAIQGLLSTTGDRYTFFAPPTAAEFDRQRTAGEFGGIGAYVGMNQSGQLIITDLFADMPAKEAGLLADDVIVAVDGIPIEGMVFDDALALLRGEIGSPITLTVYRASEDDEFTVDIARARIELPTISVTTYDDIGYIHLFLFNHNATSLLEREISVMQAQGIKGLILDLRDNPGGLLDQAVSVSDLFLNEGIVVTQRDRKGSEKVYSSDDGDLAEEIPLIVLMDSNSASASEVVAGALRDRDRAILIGETSFGKGSVQHVFDLKDGSQVRVTAAVWFTPNEIPINGQGLAPDVTVTLPENATEDDPFIEAALEYFEEQG